jgi:1,4-alpha-glucan branching enzyme
VVCNFDTINHNEYKVGVPKAGKYKEIFNTDDVKYGGNGQTNARVKTSKKEESHGRENSITITLAPLTVAMFKYSAAKSSVAEKLEEQYIEAEEKKTTSVGKKDASDDKKTAADDKKATSDKETTDSKKTDDKKPASGKNTGKKSAAGKKSSNGKKKKH